MSTIDNVVNSDKQKKIIKLPHMFQSSSDETYVHEDSNEVIHQHQINLSKIAKSYRSYQDKNSKVNSLVSSAKNLANLNCTDLTKSLYEYLDELKTIYSNNDNQAKLDINQVSHDINQVSHDINQVSHDINQVSHDINQVSHDINQVSHDINQVSHDINQVSHDINQVSHDINQVSHDINQVSHDINQDKHEDNQAKLDINESKLVINQDKFDINHESNDTNYFSHDINESKLDTNQDEHDINQAQFNISSNNENLIEEVLLDKEISAHNNEESVDNFENEIANELDLVEIIKLSEKEINSAKDQKSVLKNLIDDINVNSSNNVFYDSSKFDKNINTMLNDTKENNYDDIDEPDFYLEDEKMSKRKLPFILVSIIIIILIIVGYLYKDIIIEQLNIQEFLDKF